jgi:hypothetical protein
VSEWQPIETAPKEDREVLVTDGFDIWQARYIDEDTDGVCGYWTSDYVGFECYDCWPKHRIELGKAKIKLTHWMPLPEPPLDTRSA